MDADQRHTHHDKQQATGALGVYYVPTTYYFVYYVCLLLCLLYYGVY